MVDITIVNRVYKPTYNWGAPSCIACNTSSLVILLLFWNHIFLLLSYFIFSCSFWCWKNLATNKPVKSVIGSNTISVLFTFQGPWKNWPIPILHHHGLCPVHHPFHGFTRHLADSHCASYVRSSVASWKTCLLFGGLEVNTVLYLLVVKHSYASHGPFGSMIIGFTGLPI